MTIRMSGKSGTIADHVKILFNVGTDAGLTDGELLRSFAHRYDLEAQAAFAALVRRHGPMVIRVLSGVLDNLTDIEDAFQATFLVLARKARSIREPDAVGSWLYGVALRVAANLRAAANRRHIHERQFATMAAGPATENDRHDLETALLEEVDRLPEKYRAPVVLCYLEGLTHEAAARRLNWPVGTVEGRLARARGLLRSRLSRRGLAPAIGLLAATTAAEAAGAGLSSSCVDSTTKAAFSFAAGDTAAVGLAPARATMLAREALGAMRLGAIKMASAVMMIVALTAAFTGVLVLSSQDLRQSGQQEKRVAEPAPATAKALKVLFLQGANSSWEYRYIARALAREPDIQLDAQSVRRPVREGKGDLDDSELDPAKFGVYILGDIPAEALTRRQQERLRLLVEQGAGLIMLGGHSSFGAGGWAETAMARVLPVQINPGDGLNEPDGGLKFVLTTAGRQSTFLQVGPTEAETVKLWDQLPPILGANRLGPAKPLAVILATTPDRDPLMVAQEVGNSRVLVFGGQTWTWARSGDQGRSTHRTFWRQAIRWVGHQVPPARSR
jgi:RNA polymerase sigma factor (sigma-70 family)